MADLTNVLSSVELDFLSAVDGGADSISAFNDRLQQLAVLLRAAKTSGVLPDGVRTLALAASRSILVQANSLRDFEVLSNNVLSNAAPEIDATPALAPASAPLFRYFIDNICHPYPDAEEKERLSDETREAGWADFDKKKCEDWLNRKRHQSGYVAIARKYCDEDTEAMRNLCYAALFGSPEQKAGLHPRALEEIEEMYELLQSQYEEIAADESSPWVDDLANTLRDVIHVDLPSTGDSASDSLFANHEEADYADCSDDGSGSDDESDSESCSSATDLDSACDDDYEVAEQEDAQPPPVIGAKRKISDLPTMNAPRRRPVSRTLSSASSSSSSSDSRASFRSFSGSSVSSATSWEEDECERPTKRNRSESFSPEPASPTPDSRTTVDLWAMRVPSNAVALSKRKRDDDDLETLARNMKRSRYAALSAAAPSNIPAHHLNSLTDVCTRSWSSVVPFEVLSFSVDSELYTVDCTAIQASAAADEDDEDEDNNLADIIDLCNDPDAPDDATWATVQLHALAQALTGSRLPMSAELCADTVEVKLEELSPQELSSLGETLATTAESITAEYPLDQSLLLEDDDAFSPPELSDGESSGSSSPDRSPSPPVELESSPERLMADYAMSTRTRKELDTLQHPWFAQMFGQQGLSFFDPNTFRVECNPPPGMMAQESHPDFLAQLDL